MTIPEAAKQLRLSEQLIRVWIQNGTCPFGYIIRAGQRKTYFINEQALRKFIAGEFENDFMGADRGSNHPDNRADRVHQGGCRGSEGRNCRV